jgi:hypothetical protein
VSKASPPRLYSAPGARWKAAIDKWRHLREQRAAVTVTLLRKIELRREGAFPPWGDEGEARETRHDVVPGLPGVGFCFELDDYGWQWFDFGSDIYGFRI